jgi:hypothetical protein
MTAAQATAINTLPKRHPDEVWYAREYWSGDSKDGVFTNGDGYHYFELKGTGTVLRAYEFYESDDGEEHALELPELVGIHWFDFFGFEEEDELLEKVHEYEFQHILDLVTKSGKSS